MRKYKINISICIILSFSYFGCSDDNSNNVITPAPVDSAQFRYPFTDGSSWTYTRSSYVTDIRPDSIRHYFNNYPIVRSGKITILHDTIINSVTVKIFLEEYNYDSLIIVNRFYYLNTDTALIYYSQDQQGSSSGFVPFRIFGGNNEMEDFDNLRIFSNDNSHVTDSIVTALKYPLVTGKEWNIYYVKAQDMIRKKYLGFENVNTPAGTFSCMKLQDIISFPNYFNYYYYSKYGLMKRYFLFDNITYTTPENPDGVGTVDYSTEIVVTSFNIIPD